MAQARDYAGYSSELEQAKSWNTWETSIRLEGRLKSTKRWRMWRTPYGARPIHLQEMQDNSGFDTLKSTLNVYTLNPKRDKLNSRPWKWCRVLFRHGKKQTESNLKSPDMRSDARVKVICCQNINLFTYSSIYRYTVARPGGT